jgi:hypothetical protein
MIMIGDVHGCWADLVARLQSGNVHNQHLVQVGDFGLGFGNPNAEARQLALLDRYLAQNGCVLLAARGNHDCPDAFTANSQQRQWKTIHLVPDYTVLSVDGKRLLFAGGAISIDRKLRTAGADYWRDEGFVLDPARLDQLDLTDLYGVVTHTAPEGVYPYALGDLVYHYAYRDVHLLAELPAERRALAEFRALVEQRATPTFWWYGHFHEHMIEEVGPTRFVLLNVLQCYDSETGRTW